MPRAKTCMALNVDFCHAAYVPERTEGISKGIYNLAIFLSRLGISVKLRAPQVKIEQLNRKSNYFIWGIDYIRSIWAANEEADIIHCHLTVAGFGIFARLAKLLRPLKKSKSLIAHLWGPYYEENSRHEFSAPSSELMYHRIFNSRIAAKIGLKGLPTVVVGSEFLKRQVQNLGLREVFHIPNGVDVEKYTPPEQLEKTELRKRLNIGEEEKVVLYHGHTKSTKGLDDLIVSFSHVLKEFPRCKLVIARTGLGTEEQKLRRIVGSLHLDNKVIFFWKTFIPELIKSADIGVIPMTTPVGTASHSSSLLEFLSCGIPVVATDVGSNGEVVQHDKNGYLVRPRSPTMMASAILRLLESEDDCKRFAVRGRKLAEEQFDWRRIAKRVTELYDRLAEA